MKNFDANLLRVLAVLLEERSVTAAAERLYKSQSAVSKQLGKLRETFDDPLFERQATHLNPTPKALSLAPRVFEILNQLDQLAIPLEFEPQHSQRTFQFDLCETAYSSIFLDFMPPLLEQAPNIKVLNQPWSDNSVNRLLRREVDFGVGIFEWDERAETHYLNIPDELHYVELMRDSSVCLMRKNHPALAEEWTMDTFLKHRHIELKIGGMERWLLNEVLSLEHKQLNTAVNMPDINSAMKLCARSDLFLCCPASSVDSFQSSSELVAKSLPLDLKSGGLALVWHKHFDNDPSHKWLRELIISSTSS
ncbi:LysR family transcriptional regulator [Vibrio sp. T187]|uniref:LysR family transcriptional regulator n=1 Tax=Vibrio TaxID=662 RepID=UPI0010C9C529|nr:MULTISPECIES: LysR family transcriptional regulator [Vibrio]MBW3697836.1 LysR family transcriptional regulator [Vibrio sp. T187]